MHVAILGLGPSLGQFLEITKRLGGSSRFCDQVWGINALGDVFKCDIVFHMDDVRIQQLRADAAPESNIAAMLKWMKTYKGRIITSMAHEDYPALEEFPLASAINEFPTAYFNNTAAYAVAYAILVGAKKVSLFGIDFTYPNSHDAEKGRACVEFWLGIATQRNIELSMPNCTSLLDAMYPKSERFYGYDCVEMDIQRDKYGIRIDFKDRETLPTAEEVEAKYDHSRHPNALVEAA